MGFSKTSIGFIALLIIYVLVIWPWGKDPDLLPDTQIESKAKKLQPLKEIKSIPDRTKEPVIIGQTKINKDVDPAVKRLDPNVQLDHTLKTTQEVIEGQGYGTFPPVDMKEMNAHKEHVLNALADPANNSGAISIVGKREKFDLTKYKENPSFYIDSVEPGRAFDVAIPGQGIKPIERVGYASIHSEQNKPVSLTAKVDEGMPISFTAFDGGHFQNGLAFITLKADASGVATAELTPTGGVINQSRIRAASPTSSGTLQ